MKAVRERFVFILYTYDIYILTLFVDIDIVVLRCVVNV